jgi:hypothetical protein
MVGSSKILSDAKEMLTQALGIDERNRRSLLNSGPVVDIYELISDEHTFLYQLNDGRVYVYNRGLFLGMFRYYGGKSLWNIYLNTKNYIDRDEVYETHMIHFKVGEKLNNLLQFLLPNAGECSNAIKNAMELALIESSILDANTEYEITNINSKSFCVSMVNRVDYFSCSFKYLRRSGKLKKVFIRWSRTHKDIRLEEMETHKDRRFLYEDILSSWEAGELKMMED